MERLGFILDQVDSYLSIIIATLCLTELFTLCLVLLAAVNATRLSKKVNGTLQAVQKLKRSADNQRLREVGAPFEKERIHSTFVEDQAPTSPHQE
jgi:hypothetical protein